MFFTAKVLGQIFANPPFYILRCLVATEGGCESEVVKGKIPGPVGRGYVFTFKGKNTTDKNGRTSIEISRTPINPKWLQGSALSCWADWSSKEMQESVEVFSLLSESGANVKTINSLWREIGKNPKAISENPWILVQKGVNFKVADNIALKLLGEIDPTCQNRVEASILWSLKLGVMNGHCCLDANTVFKDSQILTGVSDAKEIAGVVKVMKEKGSIYVDKDGSGKNVIYTPSFYEMECEIADYLNRKCISKTDEWVTDSYISSFSRFDLTEDQIKGIRQGLVEGVSIVTGLPGTGKTTILNTLTKMLLEKREKILLVAPTGIAAKRVSSLTGLEAFTIHRAFGAGMPDDEKAQKSDYEGVKKDEDTADSSSKESDQHIRYWKYHPQNPRSESVVIIDEASMVDIHLMWRVLRGISPTTRVIMVGDIEQLPPVGAGFALKEIIESRKIPRIHLEDIFRQGEGSGVVKAAHKIYRGLVPTDEGDYEFLELRNNYASLMKLLGICKELKLEGIDFHVMSPTHHGTLGVTNLNRELRYVLNPQSGSKQAVKVGGDEIREGDRVMITQNDYELDVFNGDIGYIHHISKESVEVILKGVKKEILVSIPRKRVSQILRLAYATTVHKAQGQEYNTIIMPMVMDHGTNLLQRSLFYTAITRATDKVYILGEKDSIFVAVNNNSSSDMLCGLKNRVKYDIPF